MQIKNTEAPGWSVLGRKSTKIVATIGPASEDKEILKEMVRKGMNVARLNFSHNDYEWHGKIIKIIRELSEELRRPIGILADLQGPRIRVGNTEKFTIEKGEVIFVSDKKSTSEKELVIDSEKVGSALRVGERILIEDGLMELKVIEKEKDKIKAEVINGGEIKPRKGINVPDTSLHFGAVTAKDEKDLEFSLQNEVDFVALSFVSNGKEIEETWEKIKIILKREHDLPQIISKIERKEALKNIDEIIQVSDAIMVARGDLGIEMDESKVVIYQKEIIAKCLKNMKPVIVATQMLDSMIKNPIPTRAEVADVSNAVIDHADAVMLSGESANGKFPVKAVEMMSKIICNTEESPFDDIVPGKIEDPFISDYISIISGAHKLAKVSGAAALVMFTESGFTARMAAHYRPGRLMFAATDNKKTYNQLSLIWGIKAYLFQNGENNEHFIELLLEKVKSDKKLLSGDKVVVIIGSASGGKKMRLVGIQTI